MNPVDCLAHQVSQSVPLMLNIRVFNGIWEVKGSNPVRDSTLFFLVYK